MSSQALDDRLDGVVNCLPEDLREIARRNLAELRLSGQITHQRLRGLLSDESEGPALRAAAAWCVGLLKDSSYGDLLVAGFSHSKEPLMIWETAKALCSIGEGQEVFLDLIGAAPSVTHRLASAHALGVLGNSSSLRRLTRILSDSREPSELRAQVAETLGSIGDAKAVPSLVVSAADPIPEVRFWSAFALGNIGDQRAVGVLERLAREDHEEVEGWGTVSEEAISALEEIRAQGGSGQD